MRSSILLSLFLIVSCAYAYEQAKWEFFTGSGCQTASRTTMYTSPVGYCSGNYKFGCTPGSTSLTVDVGATCATNSLTTTSGACSAFGSDSLKVTHSQSTDTYGIRMESGGSTWELASGSCYAFGTTSSSKATATSATAFTYETFNGVECAGTATGTMSWTSGNTYMTNFVFTVYTVNTDTAACSTSPAARSALPTGTFLIAAVAVMLAQAVPR